MEASVKPQDTAMLSNANKLRDERKFGQALTLYLELAKRNVQSGPVLFNIGICLLALGEFEKAAQASKLAFEKKTGFWQARALYTRALSQIDRASGLTTERELESLLRNYGNESHARANAELQLAELHLSVFCDAESAAKYALPWLNNSVYAEHARRIYLISRLYWRSEDDHALSAMAIDYAREFIAQKKQKLSAPTYRRRKRIGLISRMLESGPVYYLTISAFREFATQHDLILFNRSRYENWATDNFREIITQEIDCRAMDWRELAQSMLDADLDVLFELSGWTDPDGLKAVSTKPARKIYKWVGGQSMTTGLDCFDGFITDRWQSPKGAQALHSEPLIVLKGSYVRYTPPRYMPTAYPYKDKGTVGIIGNPLKLNREVIDGLIARSQKGGPLSHVKQLRFIDRRYANPRIRARAEHLLSGFQGSAIWIAPQDHEHFLETLSKLEAVLDTSPYSMGLTAHEALHLGVKIVPSLKKRTLFSSLHSGAILRHKSRNHEGVREHPQDAPTLPFCLDSSLAIRDPG